MTWNEQAFKERQDRLGQQAHGRRLFDDAMKRCAYCQERRRKVLKAPNGARICKACAAEAIHKPIIGEFSGNEVSCKWCGTDDAEWMFAPRSEENPTCCDRCCRKAAAL